jgi:hypothetical protein
MQPLQTPVPAAAPKKAVSPRHALLEELIGIAIGQVNEQFTGLAAKLSAALLDVDEHCDAREIHQRFKAGNMLKNKSYAFLHLASSGLERALRKEIALLAPRPKLRVPTSSKAMSLVPYEEMDSKVTFSVIGKPFEVMYADHLATLNVRLAFLLDRDILRVNQNPFRPEVFLVAMQEAWCEFEPDPESAGLLLPLLKPELFLDLGSMFEALNLTLMRKGRIPGSVDQRRREDSHDATPKAPKTPDHDALALQLRQFFSQPEARSDSSPGLHNDLSAPAFAGFAGFAPGEFDLTLPNMPNGSGKVVPPGAVVQVAGQAAQPAAPAFAPPQPAGAPAWPQGAASAFHGAVDNHLLQQQVQAVQRQPLLAYLARLQQMAGAFTGQLAAPGQGAAVDAPAPRPAPPVQDAPAPGATPHNVIYLPGIKQSAPAGSLTRADENTIDLLTAVFDTVFQDQNISQEIRELIGLLQIPVLKAALADKDFFFQEAHPARRLIELLSKMGWEKRKGPQDPLFQAMQRSVDRVGRDAELEASVFAEAVTELEATLRAEEEVAASAIAEPIASALKQEKIAEAGRSAREAVGLRIATGEVVKVVEGFLENKWVTVMTVAYTVEDSKPGAVRNATRAMDELIWSVKPKLVSEERRALIAKLPPLLATLNKWLDVIKWQDADRLRFFADLAECHASIVRAPLELSPERQVEIAMEVAQRAAERRRELEERAASPTAVADPVEDEATLDVDMLRRGMWLEFSADGAEAGKVKLAWISPRKTLFIFSTSARQEAFSLSGEALAQRFRSGSVRLLPSEGLVGRALSQALQSMQGAVNDG